MFDEDEEEVQDALRWEFKEKSINVSSETYRNPFRSTR